MEIGVESIKDFFEFISYISVALGIPFFLYQFTEDRKDREYGTFDSLDDKYTQFQMLCLEYPELNIHDIPFENEDEISDDEKKAKQEEAALWILISLFERAFLMYQRHSEKVRQGQFEGWLSQMQFWYERANFRSAWALLDEGDYDREFMRWFENNVVNKYQVEEK